MITLSTLSAFLGWATLINSGLLILAALALLIAGDWVKTVHRKLFKLDSEDLSRAYFQYLAQYKIAILVFNLVPWIVLKIIT